MIRVTILISLYRGKDFIQGFLEYAAGIGGLRGSEFFLLNNNRSKEQNTVIHAVVKDTVVDHPSTVLSQAAII